MGTLCNGEKRHISKSLNVDVFQCAGVFARGTEHSTDPAEHAQVSMFEAIISRYSSFAYLIGVPRAKLPCGADFSWRHGIGKRRLKLCRIIASDVADVESMERELKRWSARITRDATSRTVPSAIRSSITTDDLRGVLKGSLPSGGTRMRMPSTKTSFTCLAKIPANVLLIVIRLTMISGGVPLFKLCWNLTCSNTQPG